MYIQIQEANKTSNFLNTKRPVSRHILLKQSKFNDKEKNSQGSEGGKTVTYKGYSIRLTSDYSAETL